MWLVEGTGSGPGQRGCADGTPGGLALELGASQAEDRGWGPMSLKTGAGGATGFALLMKADFISLRPLAAVRRRTGAREREREEEEEEGAGEKERGRWSVCVCVCVCLHVGECAHACTLAGVKSGNGDCKQRDPLRKYWTEFPGRPAVRTLQFHG